MNDKLTEFEAHYLAERRQRFRVVMIAVPAFAGLLIAYLSSGLSEEYFMYRLGLQKEVVLAMIAVLLGTSGLALIMTYLQTGFKKSEAEFEAIKFQREIELDRASAQEVTAELNARIEEQIQDLKAEVERARIATASISAPDRAELIKELRTQINQQAGTELLNEIKAQATDSFTRDGRDRELLQRFDESRTRFTRELEALSRRGNLNLGLGAVTTVLGIGILGISVFAELTEIKDLWSFVSHFVPRFTLVVLIELFAYFFLSLYKASLGEIKYFQNEITNIEAKQTALRTAIHFGEPSAIANIVSKLAETERNHILSKEQTTVELEKARIDRDGRNDFAKLVAEFFQKKA